MAILVVKSAPRLISVLLLLLVVAPFLLLAITLGGVSLRGLMTALLGLLVYSAEGARSLVNENTVLERGSDDSMTLFVAFL